MIELKPCPFCGGKPFTEYYDRLIVIGCKPCGYHRSFYGLIQSEINTGLPIVYEGGKVSDHEWYDQFAHEKAHEAWNRRAERWIPCSERLPEATRKRYWVCTDAEGQYECRWTNNRYGLGESDEWGWSIFDIPQYSKVVAWMSLPEPYKEEE